MTKAICSECGSPVEIADGEKWGYCPMCENDQVELNKNLKLSLENAVEFIPDKRNLENSEEDYKEINNFVKGLLYKDFIEKSYKIDVLEKALELAHIELQQYSNEDYYSGNNPTWYREDFNWKNYLLMKAEDEIKKEMMKSE